MIDYPRTEEIAAAPLKVRFLGLGNAGIHLADRLTMAAHADVEIIALNTDLQSLASSIAPQKVPVGQKATRGLGTGGDPEVGYDAAQESLDEIRSAVAGAQLIFLCAGLGGGTASGIISTVAELAREAGAIVFAVVTSPFAFEGKRRTAQAAEALHSLAQHAHAIIHFPNDRMSEISSPRGGIEETFAASDACLLASVTSLLDILRGGSPMPVSLADLLAAIGGGSATALFGRGEATGENRAHEALERALKSPLLDRGRLLEESNAVIAHISGPPSLSFSEVAAIMRELGKHTAEGAHLFLGVTTRSETTAPVTVIVLGNYQGADVPVAVELPPARVPVPQTIAPPPARRAEYKAPVQEESQPEAAASAAGEEPPPLFTAPPTQTPPPPVAPVQEEAVAPRRPAREPRPAAAPKPTAAAAAAAKAKQETLQFESIARGRFEKSEPTIVEGEDLDVPTFLRMRNKTK